MSRAQLLAVLILTAILPTRSFAQLGYYPPPVAPPTLIRVGRLLDVRTGKYLVNQGILTEAGRIKEIGAWEDCLLYTSPSPRD